MFDKTSLIYSLWRSIGLVIIGLLIAYVITIVIYAVVYYYTDYQLWLISAYLVYLLTSIVTWIVLYKFFSKG